jgi:hypothetical protein
MVISAFERNKPTTETKSIIKNAYRLIWFI